MARRIRGDARALDEVVAIALMIGIVIALAFAVAIVLRLFASEQTPPVPNVLMQSNDGNDRLVLVGMDDNADWRTLSLRYLESQTAGTLHIGSDPTPFVSEEALSGLANSVNAGDSLALSTVSRRIVSSDYIELCGSVDLEQVQVRLVDTVGERIMGTFTFGTVAAC